MGEDEIEKYDRDRDHKDTRCGKYLFCGKILLQNSNRTIHEKRNKIPESEEDPNQKSGLEPESEEEHKREMEAHPNKRRDESVDEEIFPANLVETTLCRDETDTRQYFCCLHKNEHRSYIPIVTYK